MSDLGSRNFGPAPAGYVAGVGRGATAIVAGVSRTETQKPSRQTERIGRKDEEDADKIYDEIDLLMRKRNRETGGRPAAPRQPPPPPVKLGPSSVGFQPLDWENFTEATPLVKKPKTADNGKSFPVGPVQGRVGVEEGEGELLGELDRKKTRKLLENLQRTTPEDPQVYLALIRVMESVAEKRSILIEGRLNCPQDESIWLASLEQDFEGTRSLALRVMGDQSAAVWLAVIDREKQRGKIEEMLKEGLGRIPGSVALWEKLLEIQEISDLDSRRQILRHAVKAVPSHVGFWTALAREVETESVEESQQVLREARQTIKQQVAGDKETSLRCIWLEALRLMAGQSQSQSLLGEMATRAVEETCMVGSATDVSKDPWWAVIDTLVTAADEDRSLKVAFVLTAALLQMHQVDSAEAVSSLAESLDRQVGDLVVKVASESALKTDGDLWFQRITDALSDPTKLAKEQDLLQVFDAAVATCAHEELVILATAKLALKRGFADKAKDVLRTGLAENTDSVDLLVALAKVLGSVGDFQQAKEMLEEAARLSQGAWRVQMKLAVLHVVTQNHTEALRLVNLTLEKNAGAWKLHCMRMQLSQTHDFRKSMEQALNACANCAPVWTVASDTLLEWGEFNSACISESRSLLERGRTKIPDSEVLWTKAIQLELIAEKVDAAKLLLAKALHACPSSGLLWSFAIQLEDSITRFSKCAEALKRCPEDGLVMAEVGKYFWQVKRDLSKARKWIENAVQALPRNGDIRLTLLAFNIATLGNSTVIDESSLSDCNRGVLWTAHAKKFANLRKPLDEVVREFLQIHFS